MESNSGPIEILHYDTMNIGGDLSALPDWHGIHTALNEEDVYAHVRRCPDTEIAQIGQWLDKFRPGIVHLVAHGDEDGAILVKGLYDEKPGTTRRVKPEQVAALFAGYEIKLATLRVCNGGPLGHALLAHVPTVITATSRFVSFSTASEFYKAFYRRLARGQTIATAFAAAEVAGGAVNASERMELMGDGDVTIPFKPAPDVDETTKPDVCIIASTFAAHHVQQMADLLAPLTVMHASDDTRYGETFDDWADRIISEAPVVMVLHEPRLKDLSGASADKEEQAWYVFDQVVSAISRRIEEPGRRLFPVFLNGKPRRHHVYYGLRRLVGLDVEREGGLAAAMNRVPKLVKRARAAQARSSRSGA